MSIAALGYEIDSSQAVRAERDLDRMAAAADRAGDGAEGLERQSSGLAATLRALAPVAGAIAGSLAAMFSARAVIGAAETYETRMARINAIIRATGGVAGRTAEQLEAQAQSLARATLESVDGVMNAQQVLLTFRNVQGEVFDRAIEGAADLAAAMGTDIVGATRQLARALEDPINGVTALTRSGTVFTQQQRDQIRALVESGRTLEAQNIILAELEGQYGGAARAAGGLTAAKDSLGQSINNLLISINNSIGLTDALAVVYNRTADGVQYLADNIEVLDPILRGLGVVIASMAATQIPRLIAALATKTAGMTAASIAAGVLTRSMNVLGAAMALAGGPIGIVVGLLGGAAAYLLLFRDRADDLPPTLEDVTRAQDALNAALGVFRTGAAGAGSEAIAYARNLETTARAALVAAEAVLAFREAQMQGVSDEALDAMRAQPGWESNPMRGAMEAAARARSEVEANRAALDNARRTLAALTIQSATAGDHVSQLFSSATTGAENLTITVEGLNDALAIPVTGGGGGSGDDGFGGRLAALAQQFQSERDMVEAWYQEAQTVLADRRAQEILGEEGHRQMLLQVEHLYQQQLSAIRSQAQAQQLGETADFFGALAEVAQQGGDRMVRVARVFGAAQALINTYVGASEALRLPFPANLAAAAQVIAAGMGFVNAIKGGGKTGPSSSQPVSGVTQSQEPLRRTIVELRGAEWARGIIDPIIEEIFRASGNGQRITLA
jgi:hypothetical protein